MKPKKKAIKIKTPVKKILIPASVLRFRLKRAPTPWRKIESWFSVSSRFPPMRSLALIVNIFLEDRFMCKSRLIPENKPKLETAQVSINIRVDKLTMIHHIKWTSIQH